MPQPLYQNISIPQGMQAFVKEYIVRLQESLTVNQYNTFLTETFNIIYTVGGWVVVAYPPGQVDSAVSSANGGKVSVTFDTDLASVTGKESEFTLKVNGSAVGISSVGLTANPKVMDIVPDNPILYSDSVTVSYTEGTVMTVDGGKLLSFSDFPVTRGVSAPPTVVSMATSTDGTTITVTFNKNMGDPAGKQSQFVVKEDGVTIGVSSVALDTDIKKIILTLSSSLHEAKTITLAYVPGDVTAADSGRLAGFTDSAVTNNTISLYQSWPGLPDSPLLTALWPYQTYVGGGVARLLVSQTPFWMGRHVAGHLSNEANGDFRIYNTINGGTEWDTTYYGLSSMYILYGEPFTYANRDILNSTGTTVVFSKNV